MLNPDFRDILSAFTEEQVDFVVVGAYALAAHGLPRATGDIDLWVRVSSANSGKIWKALETFGAPMEGLSISVLGREDLIRNKTAVGRAQDMADVERLEKLKEEET